MNGRKARAALLVVMLSVLMVFSAIPYIQISAAPKQPTWPLKWVKLLDRANASISILSWDVTDDDKDGMITYYANPPRIFVVRVSDGSIVLDTQRFRTPTPPAQFQLVDASSTNKYIARLTLGRNPSVRVYYRVTGQETVIPLDYVAEPQPISVKMGSGGRFIIIGDRNGYAAVYGPRVNVDNLKDHIDDDLLLGVKSQRFFNVTSSSGPRPPYVAAGSDDNKMYFFFVRNGSIPSTPTTPSSTRDDVRSVAISKFGDYAVYGSDDNRVRYLARAAGAARWNSTLLDGDVRTVAMSADGNFVIAGTSNGGKTVYLWNSATTRTGTQSWTWNSTGGGGKPNDDILSVAISADGSRAVVGSKDKKVYYYNTASSTPLWNFATGGEVNAVTLSGDGQLIVAGSKDKFVYFFDASRTPPSTPQWSYQTGGEVNSVAISANSALVVVGSKDDTIYAFKSASSGTAIPTWRFGDKDDDVTKDILSVSVSADGSLVAVGGENNNGDNNDNNRGRIFLLDGNTGTKIWKYTARGAKFSNAIAITEDGNYIVAGNDDGKILLFQGRSNPTPIWTYTTGGNVRAVAITSGGRPTVSVTNTGPIASLTDGSALLYVSNSTGKVYTGKLASVINSAGKETTLVGGRGSDFGTIPNLADVTLVFDVPKNNLEIVPPGTYKAFIQLDGFNGDGDKIAEKKDLGNVGVP